MAATEGSMSEIGGEARSSGPRPILLDQAPDKWQGVAAESDAGLRTLGWTGENMPAVCFVWISQNLGGGGGIIR